MIFEEKKIVLKDGREAIFKTPEISDAEAMLKYIIKACGETEFLTRYPEEWVGASIDAEEAWIKKLRDSEHSFCITCFVDGEIGGNCELVFNGGMKTSHRATVMIAILKDYWNLGIGSAMFHDMLAEAQRRSVEILELELVEENERALHLYEKFGFEVVAKKPKYFKFKDGTYHSELYMQKYLI